MYLLLLLKLHPIQKNHTLAAVKNFIKIIKIKLKYKKRWLIIDLPIPPAPLIIRLRKGFPISLVIGAFNRYILFPTPTYFAFTSLGT